MIRLIHYIKERPLLLLGNHACPSLVTPSTMWNRNCYQDEMFITAETGGLWLMQKLRSAAVSFHICQDKKPNSFSLSTPLQFTLGPKYFLLFHMLFFFFFASGVQCLSVIENIVVTLLLSNFHFCRSSKDCGWVCAVSEPLVQYFFHLIYADTS